MMDNPAHPASPPPPHPKVNLAGLLRLRPDRTMLVSATRAAMASGICMVAGWLLDDQAAGLMANLGTFVALYGSGRPYHNRAILLALIAGGLVVCVVAGAEAAVVPNPWVSVAVAALIATLASFLCTALNVGPPGAYILMLACATGTAMVGQASHPGRIAVLVAAGGTVAWLLHMLGALWERRRPERRAVANAALAVADFIDSTAHSRSDLPRHRAATTLHDAWRALIAWQPAGDADTDLRQLRACSRKLHGLFAAAVREGSAGGSPGPAASAEARTIMSRVAELPSEPALAGPNERRAFFRRREMIASSFAWTLQPPLIATRVGAAALIAGAAGVMIGLERSYWAAAAAVLVLYQGLNWVLAMQRGFERTLGTMLGLILAATLTWLHPGGVALIGCIVLLQFIGQLFVVSNYAFAVAFFTPMALLMAGPGSASVSDVNELLLARGLDTILGCAVGLAVLLVTYRTGGSTVRRAIAETLAAAKLVLPFLARGEVTTIEARTARRRLRSNAFGLILLYEEQAGGTGRARGEADRAWPAIVATQRLAFRILGACWEIEAAGNAAKAPLDDDDGQAIIRALESLQAGRVAAIPLVSSNFLVPEIILLNESVTS
ncbi:FUSC family protein [Bradyrhizobium diazoefficiens]|nr:FUSC family protein [Bradyrhizobium diazoefficiens]MBR0848434.1 FUSC family protein [Bradyrhizobium diazoefficiens]